MLNFPNIATFFRTKEATVHEVNHAEIHRQILIDEREFLELKSAVGYWRSMHSKAVEREEKLKQELLAKEAEIRDLRHRIFGKKSEKQGTANDRSKHPQKRPGRPRGKQPKSKGHGRTQNPDLPVVDEVVNLSSDMCICPRCGKSYYSFGTEESEIIEVEVKAYKRRIIRKRGKKSCSCENVPETVTAAPVPRIIPKSPYGISIWEEVLLSKFLHSQPTHRLLQQLGELGLFISQGTITGGLKKIASLFEPVYKALYDQQMIEDRFHNDESGWKVFEAVEGKIGNRWWLWVSRSESVVFFQIAMGRGADVPVAHFSAIQSDKIILVCDRYSSYKSLAKQLKFIILAFCWAHVRRDFLDAARKFPKLEDWVFTWTEMIGNLYHINNQRCGYFNKELSIDQQSSQFKQHHSELVAKMQQMQDKFETFLEPVPVDIQSESIVLHEVKTKILTSLKNHWDGLQVFVKHPEVPMDNNSAERSIRNPATGRKDYYGSGSIWSSELAAMLFSIFQTLQLWDINCRHWLRAYLTTCATNGGLAPEDISSFLPWEMDEKHFRELTKPPNTS